MRIRLHFKNYYFTPPWKFILLTLLFAGLFTRLGIWQLQRAQEKNVLENTFNAQPQAAVLSLEQLTANLKSYRYYKIELTGHYDNAHSILLDNKFYQHQPGYQVLTPFIPTSGHKAVLINRGWIPATTQREQLPSISKILEPQTVRGYLYLPEKPFILGKLAENASHWPLRVQAIALEDFAQALQQPLYPFIVLLLPNTPGGFQCDWHPTSLPAYKHLGYAVQWFSFAFVLTIIFIYLNTHKIQIDEH